ncbi:MAG TPA: c-type cytochrome [Bryobacteraceae bacterium]
MRRSVSFFVGVLAAIAAIVVVGAIWVGGARGFGANEQPGAVERWAMPRLRAISIPADAKQQPNPVADSPLVQAEARAHWADHCATCHANNGSGDTEMGKHMYPPAPDMRLTATQQLTDGQLFFIIQNGIRWTGMPAWGAAHGEGDHGAEDSWKLVRFIRHLPDLTPEEEQEMSELNPKTPDELKEEQEEKEFLGGGNSNEHAHHEHH